jgi:hypothetical protein
MKPVAHAAWRLPVGPRDGKHQSLVTTPAVTIVLGAISLQYLPYAYRRIGQSIVEPLNGAIAIALSSRPTIDSKNPTLTRDPLAADPAAWTTLGGSPPEFVTGIRDCSASSTALQNPPGQSSNVFTSDLILIEPAKNYRVEFCVKQAVGVNATVYLAMAWYDKEGQLLASNIPMPAGAGNPVGWNSGTYSYFGLVGESPPTTWTVFRKSFGLGEIAVIPRNAMFVRVGALLNYKSTPAATIQLSNIRLGQKSKEELAGDAAFRSDQYFLFIIPSTQMVWTSSSQTAQMSHHWPAQQVATDLSGGVELAAAARAPGGTPVNSDGIVFDLDEKPKPSAANQ